MGAEESDEFETEGSDLGDGAEREQDPAVLLALELSKEEVSRLTETVDSLNDNVVRLNVRVNELWQTFTRDCSSGKR